MPRNQVNQPNKSVIADSDLIPIRSNGSDAQISAANLIKGLATTTAVNGPSQIVALDAQSRLPAVDGSRLLNLPTGNGGGITQETDPLSLHKDQNLADLSNASLARSNLGLGSSAVQQDTYFVKESEVGTAANQIPRLDSAGALPAVSGANLTNLPVQTFTETDPLALKIANNLSDLPNKATARTNLGLGSAATQANTFFLQTASNLSDLNNAASARSNLGLKSAALQDVGTAAGNVVQLDANAKIPALDGSQLLNLPTQSYTETDPLSLKLANNLSDLPNKVTARSNLGLGSAATQANTFFLQTANNLSDVTPATARTNLGLGSAAVLNVGTAANNVIQLTSAAKIPAVDGSLITGIVYTETDPLALKIANSLSDITNKATARTNLGLGTAATQAVGTAQGNVVQLDANAKIPAIDGSQLTNIVYTETDPLALKISKNLSDLTSTTTARTNLGLGTAAVQANSFFLQSANNLSDLASTSTALTNIGAQPLNANLTAIAGLAKTAGSLIVGNGTAFTVLPGGTTGQVLTYDSTQATGIKWATAAAGGGSTLIGQTDSATPFNTYLGSTAGGGTGSTSTYAVAIGYNAKVDASVTAAGTVAIGYNSKAAGTSVSIGNNAISALQSIAIGFNATTSTYSYGMAIGYGSSVTANFGMALGYNSTANGSSTALGTYVVASGANSTAVGAFATAAAYTSCTLMGYQSTANAINATAMGYNTIAAQQGVAIGYSANAQFNATSVGAYAGTSFAPTVSNNQNVFIGAYAGYSTSGLTVSTTSVSNTTVGGYTMVPGASGQTINQCTAIGNNIFMGTGTTYTNSTAVGYASAISASNQVRLGNSSTSVYSGTSGTALTSDARLKRNIEDSNLGLEFISRLRPVSYIYKDKLEKIVKMDEDGQMCFDDEQNPIVVERVVRFKRPHYGLIAQEVKQTMDELGVEDFAGYIDWNKNGLDELGLRYDEFISPMIKAIQELNQKITDLEKQLKERV